MNNRFPAWFQEKLFSLLSVLISVAVCYMAYLHHEASAEYIPLPQQVLLDTYHRPIGVQNLMEDTFHNPHYRKGGMGETGADFAKEALLTIFNYNKDDLTSGRVMNRFIQNFAEGEGEYVYRDIFVNLSQPRIVMAQDALVKSRLIGDLEYNGELIWDYKTLSGLTLESKTFQYQGKIMITVYAEDTYPTLYDVTIEVQRALLQDKIKGYQITALELK